MRHDRGYAFLSYYSLYSSYNEDRLVMIIFIDISNIHLHYEVKGEGNPVLLLHGWGANLNTFNALSNMLSESFKTITIDLPGFGSSMIGVPLNIEEVADILHTFCEKLNIDKPILLGHSYGGRIAIMYASKYEIEKLILVSSAGIKQKLKFSKKLRIRVYKAFKKMHIPVKMGSDDYQNADNVKRIMLVWAVNQDLKEQMKKIKVPTLLLYGKLDNVTPLELGYEIKENIEDSYLIELEECGHFPYLERPNYFSLILMSYLVGEEYAC